jgi:putative peptidoglycan lipid II flippase
LLFQRGAWTPSETPGVAEALIAFSIGLALNGVILLLTRCFFALQHVWAATAIALVNLVISAGLSLLLFGPCGVWGIPLANSLANIVVVPLMWILLSKRVGELDHRGVLLSALRSLIVAAAAGALAWAIWSGLHAALGETLAAQLIEVGTAVTFAGAAYLGVMHVLRVPEAARILALVRRRGVEESA